MIPFIYIQLNDICRSNYSYIEHYLIFKNTWIYWNNRRSIILIIYGWNCASNAKFSFWIDKIELKLKVKCTLIVYGWNCASNAKFSFWIDKIELKLKVKCTLIVYGWNWAQNAKFEDWNDHLRNCRMKSLKLKFKDLNGCFESLGMKLSIE
jgi:hypothetical protein